MLLSRLPTPLRASALRALLNVYPPFLGAGIRVVRLSPTFHTADVELRLRPWNRNYVGTHFGGSLFAMADPFFMLMLLELLGFGYVVWDKASSIRFLRPGRGTVRARFEIPQARVSEIRAAADESGKTEASFTASITDASREVVAQVDKVLSIRAKKRAVTRRPR